MKLESSFEVCTSTNTIPFEYKHSFISDNSKELSTLRLAMGDDKNVVSSKWFNILILSLNISYNKYSFN